jgi:hypothetical protein
VKTLHVFLDESGNLNFALKGSKYYVFSAAWTYDPAPLASALHNIRFGLLKQGFDLPAFHAAHDRQVHRDAVVATMAAHDAWRFGAIVVEKSKVSPSIREETRFYPQFASMMLRFVLKGCVRPGTERVVIVTDTLPIQRHRQVVVKTLKGACRSDLAPSLPFEIYHHPHESNAWLQVVDYCCWATYRKWERGDLRTYAQLSHRLERAELDVLASGLAHYFEIPNRAAGVRARAEARPSARP